MKSTNPDKKNSSILKIIFTSFSMILIALFLGSCSTTSQGEPTNTGPISYSQDVAPIFEARCVTCHGVDKQDGQLNLFSNATIMAGGKSGDVISAGNADNSKLISMVSSGKMPKRGAKLTPEQIQILKEWVNAGALDN